MFVPQITGNEFWFETRNVSVKQRVASDTPLPPKLNSPFKISPIEVEDVEGPEITKVSKSRRIWQIFSLHLQIFVEQAPTNPVEDSKYVVFCVVDEPHVKVTVKL